MPADVTIPIRVQHRNGASSADYTGVPRRLIFARTGPRYARSPSRRSTTPITTTTKSSEFSSTDLPAGFEAGARSAITVKLKDNDEGNSLPLFDPANELRNLS